MKLSIIIPTKDRSDILQQTIDHLISAIHELNAEVIIVNDSASTIKLKENNEKIFVINNPGSGAASARNAGVKQSTGELLLFLDDDITVSKANLLKTFALHQNSLNIAYMFFWVYPPELIEILPNSSFGRYILHNLLFSNSHRINITGRSEKLIKTEGLSSQYLSIYKADFLRTGGYDGRIPFAGEDYVLYKELTKNGIEVFLSTEDIIFQNESDRILLSSVMERYKRAAMSIRKTKDAGYKEVEITYSSVKKVAYSFLTHIKPFLYTVAMRIPNKKIADPLYFKLTKLLLGLSQYEGYFIRRNKE